MRRYTFIQFKPAGLRIWHWLNGLVLLGSLTTVLLHDAFFEVRPNTQMILKKVSESGGTLTESAARQIALSWHHQLWQWHIYFGFTLVGLLVWRLLVRVFAERGPFLSSFLTAWRMSEVEGLDRKKALHYNLVKTGYAAFYLALVIQLTTGLSMYFSQQLGLSRNSLGLIGEVHETMLWFFLAFIAIHIIGVVKEELVGEQGLVSQMIHGGKRES